MSATSQSIGGAGASGAPDVQSLSVSSALLQNEVARARLYMQEVQSECARQRQRLEDWPEYESTCEVRPLDHLIEELQVHERVERFLEEWIRRREQKLQAMTTQLQSLEKPSAAAEPGNYVRQLAIARAHSVTPAPRHRAAA